MAFTTTGLLLFLATGNNACEFNKLNLFKELPAASQIVINNYLNSIQAGNKLNNSQVKLKQKSVQSAISASSMGVTLSNSAGSAVRPTVQSKAIKPHEEATGIESQEPSHQANHISNPQSTDNLQLLDNSSSQPVKVSNNKIDQNTNVNENNNVPTTADNERSGKVNLSVVDPINNNAAATLYIDSKNNSTLVSKSPTKPYPIEQTKDQSVNHKDNYAKVLQQLLSTQPVIHGEELVQSKVITSLPNDVSKTTPPNGLTELLIPVPPSSTPPLYQITTKDPLLELKKKIKPKNNFISSHASPQDMQDELTKKLEKRLTDINLEQKAAEENEQHEREIRIKAILGAKQKKLDEENAARAQAKKTPKVLSTEAKRIQVLMSKKNSGNKKPFSFSDVLTKRPVLRDSTHTVVSQSPHNNTVEVKDPKDIKSNVLKDIKTLIENGSKLKKVDRKQPTKSVKTLEELRAELIVEQNKEGSDKNLFNIKALQLHIASLEESSSKFKREDISKQAAAQHSVHRKELSSDSQNRRNKVTAMLKKVNENEVKDTKLIDAIAKSSTRPEAIEALEIKIERIRLEGNANALAHPEEKESAHDSTNTTVENNTSSNFDMLSVFGSKINLFNNQNNTPETTFSAEDIIKALIDSNIGFSEEQYNLLKEHPIENLRFIKDSYYNGDSGWDFDFVTDPQDIMANLPELRSESKVAIVNDNVVAEPKSSIKALSFQYKHSNGLVATSTSKDEKKSALLDQIRKFGILRGTVTEEEIEEKEITTGQASIITTGTESEPIKEVNSISSVTSNEDENSVPPVPFGAPPIPPLAPPMPKVTKVTKNEHIDEDSKEQKKVVSVSNYVDNDFKNCLQNRRAAVKDEDDEEDGSDWSN